jgi:hypothetical protein
LPMAGGGEGVDGSGWDSNQKNFHTDEEGLGRAP